ncbi:MAG: hypothetical protein ACI8X5_001856 [Planctomycetota bacterium]|jgi:hypothetical protein
MKEAADDPLERENAFSFCEQFAKRIMNRWQLTSSLRGNQAGHFTWGVLTPCLARRNRDEWHACHGRTNSLGVEEAR